MAVTIHDVAQAAGVSVATVSRVIHGAGSVNEKMCMRVRKAIKELGYVPNPVAQSLKQQCSRMIGITASDLAVSFFPEVVNGVEKAFSPKGYATIVSSTHDLPENENTILQRMLARKVDALLVNSTGQNEDMLEKAAQEGTPIIFYDRRPQKSIFPAVYMNKNESMYLALDHLTKLGHKKIMLATGSRILTSNYDRYMGFQRFIFERNMDPRNFTFRFGDFSYDHGGAVVKSILDMDADVRPTAVITGSIVITAGILSYCKANGISIPGDLALVSSGDFNYSAVIDFKLTYLDDRTELLSENAVRLIDRCLGGEKMPNDYCEVLMPILHIGDSSGASTESVGTSIEHL